MRISDWSSDVCSSDLSRGRGSIKQARRPRRRSPSSTARCLRALQEAESALTQYAHDRDQNARLRTARDRSREAAGLQTRLARGGVVSGLEVLDVERTLASAEAAPAALNTKIAGDRVHIFMALGGGWEARDRKSVVEGKWVEVRLDFGG